MRILVTGSSGYIGTAQCGSLLEAGHQVRGFDAVAPTNGMDIEHIVGDLRDIGCVERAVDEVDCIVHTGGISNDRFGCPEEILSVNVQGTWNVLIAAVQAGIQRVVYLSSVNALGSFQGHRTTECFPISDRYQPHPMSAYQLSKHLAEETCQSYSRKHTLSTICLRPVFVPEPTHYDTWNPYDVPRGLSDYWSYVDIRDVCCATMLAISSDIMHGRFLIAAADTRLDIPTDELIDKYYPDTRWDVDRRDYFSGNPYRSLVDCSNAISALGWEPQCSWRDLQNLRKLRN